MDPETFYTFTLPIALVASVLSLFTSAQLRLFSGAMLGIAVTLVVSSAAMHFVYGHSSSSIEPMTAMEFAVEHRAYWVILAICIASAVSARIAR